MKGAKMTRKANDTGNQQVKRKNRRGGKKRIKLVEAIEEKGEEEEVKHDDFKSTAFLENNENTEESDAVSENNESAEVSENNESAEESDAVLEKNENTEESDAVSENNESSDESDADSENNDSSDESDEEEKPKSSKRKRRRRPKYNAAEEARLERLVFGDASDVIKNLLEREKSSSDNDEKIAKNVEDIPDFMKESEDSDEEDEIDEEDDCKDGRRYAVWVDEDDILCSVDTALKAQHRKLPRGRPEKVYTELLENKFSQIVGTPKWASLDKEIKSEDDDSDNEILKHSNHLAIEKVKKLRKGKIDIKALTDINKSTHTEGPLVSSLEFHPTSTVAFVAGLSGILSLFQIDGRENNKLHSIQFEKFRINCAKFLKEGTEVIVGSRHRSYSQAYDLMSGKTYRIPLPHGITNMQNFVVSPDGKLIAIAGRMGQIHLLSGATKELVANLKMNKRCNALAFSPDSTKLISHGDSEEMYIWDLRSQSCLHKAIDDGCIASASLAFSPSGQFLATGSKQGVVNIYETSSVLKKRNPSPLKIILNLTTPITSLKFNPTSEILAMASSLKENAFKMVHIPSFTVFANFPTFQTKMHNPLDIDFSPGSGYLGLSNNKGHAYLYRLKHFGNY